MKDEQSSAKPAGWPQGESPLNGFRSTHVPRLSRRGDDEQIEGQLDLLTLFCA